jgi:hypothetical protein
MENEKPIEEIVKLVGISHSAYNRDSHKHEQQGLVFQCEFINEDSAPYEYRMVECCATGIILILLTFMVYK